jgi:hypothetical protein
MRSKGLRERSTPRHQAKCTQWVSINDSDRSLKVETRVRTPLGVLTIKPQVGTAFVALTWRFLVSGDHLVVSGSCQAVQPMMGRGPEIVPRLCPPAAPRSDDNPPARPPVAKGGRRPWCRGVIRSTVAAHRRDRCGVASEWPRCALGRSLATRRCALNGRACPRPYWAHDSRAAGARRATRRRDVRA